MNTAGDGLEFGVDLDKLLPMLVNKLDNLLACFGLQLLQLLYFPVQQQEVYFRLAIRARCWLFAGVEQPLCNAELLFGDV